MKPIRTVAQEMQQQQLVSKTRSEENITQKPQLAITQAQNLNRVCVKVNGHPAIALIDI